MIIIIIKKSKGEYGDGGNVENSLKDLGSVVMSRCWLLPSKICWPCAVSGNCEYVN